MRVRWRAMGAMALLALNTGCRESHGAKMGPNDTVVARAGKQMVSLGRFGFVLPVGVDIYSYGRVLDVAFKETPWPVDSTGSPVLGAAEQAWRARLQEIRDDRTTPRPPGVVDPIIHDTVLTPGVRLLTRYSGGDPSLHVTEALRDAGAHGFRVWAAYVHDEALPQRPMIEQTVAEIAHAYRPHSPEGPPHPIAGGYHLGRGAVRRPYTNHEGLRAVIHDDRSGVRIKVNTETGHDEGDWSVIGRWRGNLMALALGVSVDRLRARKRTVAGLKGEEAVVRLSERGDPDSTELFEWYSPGTIDSPLRPMFRIEMEVPSGTAEEWIPFWDRLLDSVHALPQEVSR